VKNQIERAASGAIGDSMRTRQLWKSSQKEHEEKSVLPCRLVPHDMIGEFGTPLESPGYLLGGVNSACHWNMEIKSDRGIIWLIGVNGNCHKSSCWGFPSVRIS
jgi:hypothetical protein